MFVTMYAAIFYLAISAMKRTTTGELVLHITDDLVLSLEKSSVAAPLLRVISTQNGEDITKFLDGQDIDGSIYHDSNNLASVSIARTGSNIKVEGIVGPYTRIEPIPSMPRSEAGHIAHIIHKIDTGGGADNGIYDQGIDLPVAFSARSSTGKVPKRVDVEIFVISDTFHSKYFKTEKKLMTYVCVMINAVNIRLAETRDPQIQLIFTGLEISVNEPYLTDKGSYLSAETTIQALGHYAFNVRNRLGYPDTLYLLTGREAYGIRRGVQDTGLRGLGYNNGICSSWFVALGEDKPGTFSGVDTFAHEVGHLLGASHDGEPADMRYPQRPGARNCPFAYGYLMSYLKRGAVSHHYSSCSLAQMKYIVSTQASSCWEVRATHTYNITRKYPGMTMNTTVYCQRLFAAKINVRADASSSFASMCMVRCLYSEEATSNGQTSYKDVEALEYMKCGEQGQVCIQGTCAVPPKSWRIHE
ncbi:venom metalloproteinase antarease TserMP_A-like isoform X2 [Amblyomma americanum]